VRIVEAYFAATGGFGDVRAERRTPRGWGDPLYAVWAARAA
jgi:hypothetical protein